MADTTLTIKDGAGVTKTLAAKDGGSAGLSPYHVEDATQRAALITALSSLSTDAKLEAVRVLLAAPLTVTPTASENHLGKLGGETAVKSDVPATASFATAYASGDAIGGKLTFANMGRVTGGTGLVQMATVASKSAQTFAFDLVLFHSDPTATTFTDNGAFVLNVADYDKLSGVISFTSANWTALGGPSYAENLSAGVVYQVATGQTSLFGVLIARGAVTLASASDLKVAVKSFLD